MQDFNGHIKHNSKANSVAMDIGFFVYFVVFSLERQFIIFIQY